MARALRAWAINRRGKNSVRNLRYGPRTQRELVRGMYHTPLGISRKKKCVQCLIRTPSQISALYRAIKIKSLPVVVNMNQCSDNFNMYISYFHYYEFITLGVLWGTIRSEIFACLLHSHVHESFWEVIDYQSLLPSGFVCINLLLQVKECLEFYYAIGNVW